MKRIVLITYCLIWFSSFAFGQTITGSMSRPGATQAQAIDGFEYCRDTVVQVDHGLSLQSYGFEEVHYDSLQGWIPATLQSDTLSHDAYLVGIIGDTLILQYCGSIRLPDGHGLTPGQYYKLQTDGSIATTHEDCFAAVGHLHQDNIFRLASDFLVFCGGNDSVGGGSIDYISNVSLTGNDLVFESIGNAFSGTIPLNPGTDDADWFDLATDTVPTDINSDVYTFGKVGINTNSLTSAQLNMESALPTIAWFKKTGTNGLSVRLQDPLITYLLDIQTTQNFALGRLGVTNFIISSDATPASLFLGNNFLRFSDYSNTRSDIGTSPDPTDTDMAINSFYSKSDGTLGSAPIGTFPYRTPNSFDSISKGDFTVNLLIDKTLPPANDNVGKMFLLMNKSDTVPRSISLASGDNIDGDNGGLIVLQETSILIQSIGSNTYTILLRGSNNQF